MRNGDEALLYGDEALLYVKLWPDGTRPENWNYFGKMDKYQGTLVKGYWIGHCWKIKNKAENNSYWTLHPDQVKVL